MHAQPLSVAAEGQVAVVTVERPDLLNQLDATALRDTRRTIAALGEDRGVRGLVLHWPDEGPISAHAALLPGETLSALIARVREFHSLLLDLAGLSKPTVATIAGGLTGITCNLALVCDLRLASERVSLGQSYIQHGLPPHGGASYLWPEMAGLGRANEVLLCGAALDATRAERYRLVTRVVPAAELKAVALQTATELAGSAPVAVALAKALAQTRQRDEMESQLEAECYSLASALLDETAKGV